MPGWMLVFIGGGFGSVFRYMLSQQFNQSLSAFSLGTFLANAISCLILGLLLGLKAEGSIHNHVWLILATGFCGGFSTFSTFSAELFMLGQDKGLEYTLFYLGLSIIIGLLMIYIGFKIAGRV